MAEALAEGLYFEDLEIGRVYRSETVALSLEEIVEFARSYDPQPFHTDPVAAKESVFGELVASGWHTAALTMRLRVRGELRLAGGWVGLGVESMRWPNPVRPGDSITAYSQIVEARPSRSKPDRGIIRLQTTVRNQRDEVVFELVSHQMVRRRPAP